MTTILEEAIATLEAMTKPYHDATDHEFTESVQYPGSCCFCQWIHPDLAKAPRRRAMDDLDKFKQLAAAVRRGQPIRMRRELVIQIAIAPGTPPEEIERLMNEALKQLETML